MTRQPDVNDLINGQRHKGCNERPTPPANLFRIRKPNMGEQPEGGGGRDGEAIDNHGLKAKGMCIPQQAGDDVADDRRVHDDGHACGQRLPVITPKQPTPQQEKRHRTAAHHQVEDGQTAHSAATALSSSSSACWRAHISA